MIYSRFQSYTGEYAIPQQDFLILAGNWTYAAMEMSEYTANVIVKEYSLSV